MSALRSSTGAPTETCIADAEVSTTVMPVLELDEVTNVDDERRIRTRGGQVPALPNAILHSRGGSSVSQHDEMRLQCSSASAFATAAHHSSLPYHISEPVSDDNALAEHDGYASPSARVTVADTATERESCTWLRPFITFAHWYGHRLAGFDQSLDMYGFYPSIEQLIAFLFVCITLVLLAILEQYVFNPLLNHTLHIYFPALAASTTVVFAVPKAPIAQPRAVLLAHVSAAVIGVALANAFSPISNQLFGQCAAGAIGVGLHLALMQLTNTLHPPASATVISAALSQIDAYYADRGFMFVVGPALVGSLVIVVIASLLNNLVATRAPYPQYW